MTNYTFCYFKIQRKKVEDVLNKELQEVEAVESRDKIERIVRILYVGFK